MLNAQPHTAEWLSSKLHYHNLSGKKWVHEMLRSHQFLHLLWLWAFIQGFVALTAYLNNKSPKDDGTEYQVVKNAFKNISFSVDLPRVDFIEQLHHHKGVEDNGVVLRRRSMKRGVTSTVNVEHLFTWEMSRKQNIVADIRFMLL